MLGFLIAVAAGFLTPYSEEPLAKPLAETMRRHMAIEPGEVRLLAFVLMMVAAGLLSALFDSGNALGLAIGGGLGYFLLRLVAALRVIVEGRKPD